jgi:thiol-disulfide isomerase/thioredoxin
MADTRQADRLAEQVKALLQSTQAAAVQPASPAAKPNDSTGEPDRLTKKSQWSNWTVLAMIVLCFFVIVRFRPFARNNTGEGQTLSQLRLQPLTGQGQPVTLADLTGRVVLINFWEARSSLSREALPHMAAIEKQFRGQPAFRLLAVSCDRRVKEDFRQLREHTRAALEEKNVDLPTYGDPGGVSRSAVEEAVGLSGYPTTLILDRWGRIRRAWTGFQPGVETEMRQLITQLLDEG